MDFWSKLWYFVGESGLILAAGFAFIVFTVVGISAMIVMVHIGVEDFAVNLFAWVFYSLMFSFLFLVVLLSPFLRKIRGKVVE